MNEHDGTMHDGKLHELAGKFADRAAARVDVEATAQAVVRRLREPAAVAPRWSWNATLRIAAVVAVLAGGGMLASRLVPRPAAADVALIDLVDYSADDLQQLLATFDETLAAPQADTDTGFEGLTEQQLREVLRTLEG
jgi:anti-sigma factor RsiW